jgi:hypothetical protein
LNVNDLYSLIKSYLNKNQAGGLNVTDFQNTFNTAQDQYFQDLVGRFQQYQPGRSIPRVGLSDNETVTTKLSPFIENGIIGPSSSGSVVKPDDFIRLLDMRYGTNKVFRVEHDKLWSALSSTIDPPSTTNIYYVEYSTFWTVYPNTIVSITIDYLRRPARIVWNYSTDADGRYVYQSSGSVDPEWDDISTLEIATRCMKILGVHFKDGDFMQYGQSVINNGE